MFKISKKWNLQCYTKVLYRSLFTEHVLNSLPAVEPVNLAYNTYASTGVDYGAPPLIIMHGLFGSKKNWNSLSKRLVEKLTPSRKIITVDARNHADSPHSPYHTYAHLAQDVYELLKQLNIDRAALMGHSMGGNAMMFLALKYPNLVDRVISVDITPLTSPTKFSSLDYTFHMMKTVELSPELSQGEGRKKAADELLKVFNNRNFVNFLLQNLKKLDNGNFAWKLNIKNLESNIDKIIRFPEDILNSNQYRGPVLVIGGTRSDFVNSSDLPALKKPFPNITFNWVDSGHLIHFERPDEFFSILVNFLRSNV